MISNGVFNALIQLARIFNFVITGVIVGHREKREVVNAPYIPV
tara:strand:- start:316 stop:444 length:129 start_codon:yes stop_codon:yes gene_type:complete